VEFGQNGNLANNMNDWIPVSVEILEDAIKALQAVQANGIAGGYFHDSVRWQVAGSLEELKAVLPEPPKQDA
jgi:hypothetical protein